MNVKEKAEQLVHTYRMLFMDIGEDYGEEILVSVLSKQCALIAVDKIIIALKENNWQNQKIIDYYEQVKIEIEKL